MLLNTPTPPPPPPAGRLDFPELSLPDFEFEFIFDCVVRNVPAGWHEVGGVHTPAAQPSFRPAPSGAATFLVLSPVACSLPLGHCPPVRPSGLHPSHPLDEGGGGGMTRGRYRCGVASWPARRPCTPLVLPTRRSSCRWRMRFASSLMSTGQHDWSCGWGTSRISGR